MDEGRLFVWQVDELREIVKNPTSMGALRASAILRFLLLDQAPALHRIAGHIGYKIRFGLSSNPEEASSSFEFGMPSAREGVIFKYENMDPAFFGKEPRYKATFDQFLKFNIQMSRGEYLTVKETIQYLANKAGGVHFSVPDEPKLKMLHDLNIHATNEEISPGMFAIFDIASITIKAVEPVYKALRA